LRESWGTGTYIYLVEKRQVLQRTDMNTP
jgi:hypothetical protein